jgi:hypothetical protein
MSIDNLNARLDKYQNAIITVGVRVTETAQIDMLIKKLKNIAAVENVFRSTL